MKKIITALFMGMLLIFYSSCGPGKKDYIEVADSLCSCTENYKENSELLTLGLISEKDAKFKQYVLCISNAKENKDVDYTSELLLNAIRKKCPELEEVHCAFLKDTESDSTGSKK